MDIGLTSQQRLVVRRARAKHLRGSRAWLIVPPLWLIALGALLAFLIIWHPGRYLALLLIPPVGLWQRRRISGRIAEWALDLRQL
jgi:hypothetical protein